MYVGGNPIMYKDPTGHIACGGFCVGGVIALVAVLTTPRVAGDTVKKDESKGWTKENTKSVGDTDQEYARKLVKNILADILADVLGAKVIGGVGKLVAKSKVGKNVANRTYKKAMKIANNPRNFKTGKGKSVFYSGKGNRNKALSFAKKNKKTPIDFTKGGKKLNDLKLYDVKDSQNYADKVWKAASKNYAEQAKGKVNKFIKGHAKGRVYHSIEKPILRINKAKGVITKYKYHK